jgi:hypothetical protein
MAIGIVNGEPEPGFHFELIWNPTIALNTQDSESLLMVGTGRVIFISGVAIRIRKVYQDKFW